MSGFLHFVTVKGNLTHAYLCVCVTVAVIIIAAVSEETGKEGYLLQVFSERYLVQ